MGKMCFLWLWVKFGISWMDGLKNREEGGGGEIITSLIWSDQEGRFCQHRLRSFLFWHCSSEIRWKSNMFSKTQRPCKNVLSVPSSIDTQEIVNMVNHIIQRDKKRRNNITHISMGKMKKIKLICQPTGGGFLKRIVFNLR